MSPSPSVQLITNATVAQYIHEISVRHRPRGPESPPSLPARTGGKKSASRRPAFSTAPEARAA
jgi:hypothetical protein